MNQLDLFPARRTKRPPRPKAVAKTRRPRTRPTTRNVTGFALPPDGNCGHCGTDMDTVGKVHDGTPYCVPCAACWLPFCAAWAVTPGGLCAGHEPRSLL